MNAGLLKLKDACDRWLFELPSPSICSLLRIAYAPLLMINFAMWWRESDRWFSDAGVLQAATMQEISAGAHPSLLYWLPGDPIVIKACLALCMVQTALLWLGVLSRFQMACLFVWLVSFQHRNMLICDGQDVLMRLLAFYLIFMPLDHAWSLARWWRERKGALGDLKFGSAGLPSAWGLRLVQLQITAIYLSTAWEKYQGTTWRDGTALFYVARMDDLYGRFALPDVLFETPWMLAAMTWGVLCLEALLPVLLWPRRTRFLAFLLACGLHLSIEATMNIFLFEWLMLVSLLSFAEPQWFQRNAARGRIST